MRIVSLKFLIILIAIGIIAVPLSMLFYTYTFTVRASVHNLYATTCLGGWKNTSLASGAPDISKGDEAPRFTETNSAKLDAGTLAQIYCGGFTGDILENTIPQKILVKFSWAIKYPELENKSEVEPPIVEPLIETPTPEQVPEPAPLLYFLAPTARAQEINNQESVEEALIIPTDDIGSEIATTTNIANNEIATTTENAIASVTPEISYGQVEVMYTLDGVEWESLGFVGKNEFSDKYFEIPIEKASRWEDISKIQIGIHSVPVLDSIVPSIYLDAIWLEVEYQNLLEDPFPPPGSLEGDIIISTTPFENITAVLVSRESKSILKASRHEELWLFSVSSYSNNSFMTEWQLVAEDAILSDNPRITFSDGNLFWVGKNDENAWRFNPSSGGYESISGNPGEPIELFFDDRSGEPHKLQVSPEGVLEILEIIEVSDEQIIAE